MHTGVVLGLSKLKENITIDDGIWNKGYKAEIFILEASVGFPLIDKKSFKIAPYFGIDSTIINGKKEIYLSDAYRLEERYNVEFNNTTFLLGLNFDIKIKPKMLEYYYVTIGYAYYLPNFEKKYDRFNGDIHLLSFGWGRFSRPKKRV
ncbi:hypothetical protein [Flavisericum labens]|uniref:hypothetical protein n=1 Tax=Flavisericum labens TaxID=3377112 RepID=UPI00387AFD61